MPPRGTRNTKHNSPGPSHQRPTDGHPALGTTTPSELSLTQDTPSEILLTWLLIHPHIPSPLADDFALTQGDLKRRLNSLTDRFMARFHTSVETNTQLCFFKPTESIDATVDLEIVQFGRRVLESKFTSGVVRVSPIAKIGTILPTPSESDHLHLVVIPHGTFLKLTKAEDTVVEMSRHRLYNRYQNATVPIPKSPSDAAKSIHFVKFQADPKYVTYNGHWGEDTEPPIALPVRLFHPVFDRFLSNLSNPDFGTTEEIVGSVEIMMARITKLYPQEELANTDLAKDLCSILGRQVDTGRTVNNAKPDGQINTAGQFIAPLLVLENKRSLGESGCDPLVQGSYSARQLWLHENLVGIRDRCCCPTFIIAGSGAHLGVLGLILTDKVVVQHLTDIVSVGRDSSHQDPDIWRVACIFTSLRLCLDDLAKFYETVMQIPKEPIESHPRFFPYATSYKSSTGPIKFRFTQPLEAEDQCVAFLGETTEEPLERIVIKFVTRYGVEVHEKLAKMGRAPRLRFIGSIDGSKVIRESPRMEFGLCLGPIRMVVMDYVEGGVAQNVPQSEWPATAAQVMEEAVLLLHKEELVLGDLRPPNVIFHPERGVQFIDFDWAGRKGQARYPRHLNKDLTWHPDAGNRKGIEESHDLFMIETYFRRAGAGG